MDMNVALLNPTCSDEDLVEYVRKHYFTTDELATAQRMVDEGTPYEEARAYLTNCCQYPVLRRSNDTQTHMLITLPNGVVKAWHPERRFPDFQPVLVCAVADMVGRAFPRPPTAVSPSTQVVHHTAVRYESLSLFADIPDTQGTQVEKRKGKPSTTRSRKPSFVEQKIHVGTKKVWSSQRGWVIKKGYLGYVVRAIKHDFIEISLIHLVSNHVMASLYISAMNETTHPRIQAWVAEANELTDWSRGIASILREKAGKQQKGAWSRYLEERWQKFRDQHYQLSLFD